METSAVVIGLVIYIYRFYVHFYLFIEKEIEYYSYYNMKYIYDDRYGEPPTNSYNWKPLQLSPHPNFEDSLVNLDHSAVHVPINVYEVTFNNSFNSNN